MFTMTATINGITGEQEQNDDIRALLALLTEAVHEEDLWTENQDGYCLTEKSGAVSLFAEIIENEEED